MIPLLKYLEPDPDLNLFEWAVEHFYLPSDMSEPGKWNHERTPFAAEPLFELSPQSKTTHVTIMKPTQLAGTTIAIILLLGMMKNFPSNAQMIFPTSDMAEDFSKTKFTPVIEANPEVHGIIVDRKSRNSSNTILKKNFLGGRIHFSGSNTGAVFRSASNRIMILDDIDIFEQGIGVEGDPRKLAEKRTGSFRNRKLLIISSPTNEHSHVYRSFMSGSQGYFCVPCPNCNEFQFLEFFHQLKFDIRDIENSDVYYECKFCRHKITEDWKPKLFNAGKYIHKFPKNRHKSFTWNALYTPVGWPFDWRYIAKEYKEAEEAERREGSDKLMIVFFNTLLAQIHKKKTQEFDWKTIQSRAEPYRTNTAPEGVRIITAGIDPHPGELYVSLYGWGLEEEGWFIMSTVITGDIHFNNVWDQLDDILAMQFPGKGGKFGVFSAVIDTKDGKTTQIVRNYCRTRPRVIPIEGKDKYGMVIGPGSERDITLKDHKIKKGVRIHTVGKDMILGTLYGRLFMEKRPDSRGYIHFPIGLPDSFYEELTAMEYVTEIDKKTGQPKSYYKRTRERNEGIMGLMYAYAAAWKMGLGWFQPPKPKPPPQQPKQGFRRPKWLENRR